MKAVDKYAHTEVLKTSFVCSSLIKAEIHEYILLRQVKIATTKHKENFSLI